MDMARLRHSLASFGLPGKLVAVQQRDPLEVIREHPRGKQARHAGACHDGMTEPFS
jgi:hypothetical protein